MFYHFKTSSYISIFLIMSSYTFQGNFIIEFISNSECLVTCCNDWNMIHWTWFWQYSYFNSFCTASTLTIRCLVNDVICSCFCCIHIMFYNFQACCYISIFLIMSSYIFQGNFITEFISNSECLVTCCNDWNVV